MGIEALPPSTVRTIGATQVLNDPTSVIKELLDNALDAQSTSISIEIHSNTLDSIQVRDNGHGIPPEDRLLVARPHCTSKISAEDDLKTIGGTSLGFRGEALASAAEMSGTLTISTRVEGEEVATALKINQLGEVVGQDRASLPVGTTVKINDFIKSHPVRRQVALKNAEKTLSKIKQTLKAYAFARPHVRISFRVLKAKNDKGNWTYAPKTGGNAEDAAFKIVGTTCASQCTWSVIEEHGYTLQAFLPKPDAEVNKYSNIGPYLSVDSRPVSVARGTPKQIIKVFREALKACHSKTEGVKDPFIFLDIRCPSASYDANVEPAKDDVLFEDPDMLIGLVRRLFDAIYPAQPEALLVDRSTQAEQVERTQQTARADEDDFITSLEPAAVAVSTQRAALWTPLPTDTLFARSHEDDNFMDQIMLGSASRRTFRPNMYGCDEEDLDFVDDRPPSGRTEADFEELRKARHDVTVSNPWILAKMNASASRQPVMLDSGDEDVEPGNSSRRTLQRGGLGLLTPGPSSPTKPTQPSNGPTNFPAEQNSTDGRSIGSQSLPPPGPTTMPPPGPELLCNEERSEPLLQQTPAYNYNPAALGETPVSGTPLSMIPDLSPRRRQSPRKPMQQSKLNTPFKPPTTDQPDREKVWFDHLEIMDRGRAPRRPYQNRENNGLVLQGELGDLVDDPRPLTPPRRNRDMRDFFTPRHQDGEQSITEMIESRQYPQQRRARSARGLAELLQERGCDDNEQTNDTLDARGVIPASELATIENEDALTQADASRSTKRRKTNEKRALREISGNAALHEETFDSEREMDVAGHSRSVRHRDTEGSASKARRTKSSRLPLERVPKGQGMHDLVVELSRDMREISSTAGKIDEEHSLLGWNETSLDAYDVFATAIEPNEVRDITNKLHELLAIHVPEGEMVQELGAVVQGALAAHAQQAFEMNA